MSARSASAGIVDEDLDRIGLCAGSRPAAGRFGWRWRRRTPGPASPASRSGRSRRCAGARRRDAPRPPRARSLLFALSTTFSKAKEKQTKAADEKEAKRQKRIAELEAQAVEEGAAPDRAALARPALRLLRRRRRRRRGTALRNAASSWPGTAGLDPVGSGTAGHLRHDAFARRGVEREHPGLPGLRLHGHGRVGSRQGLRVGLVEKRRALQVQQRGLETSSAAPARIAWPPADQPPSFCVEGEARRAEHPLQSRHVAAVERRPAGCSGRPPPPWRGRP